MLVTSTDVSSANIMMGHSVELYVVKSVISRGTLVVVVGIPEAVLNIVKSGLKLAATNILAVEHVRIISNVTHKASESIPLS